MRIHGLSPTAIDRDLQREIDAMMIRGMGKAAFVGLGLTAMLAVTMVGCGGGGGSVDDGIVVPGPMPI